MFLRHPNRRHLLTRWLPASLLALGRRPVAAGESPMAEARALWVNRFEYDSASDIKTIFRKAAQANFNLVYFQVRGAGDAFYRSEIEPCAVGLCGQLGGDPPYDPLAVAVQEGKKRGLQVHAWINALTGWSSGSDEGCGLLKQPADATPRQLLLEHPDWAVVDRNGDRQTCPNDEEYVYLSPAFSGVRERLAAVAVDIANRYDVGGIHLDRIRLPGKSWTYDSEALRQFAADPEGEAWDGFRRSLVNATVKGVFEAIQKVDPGLALSASVWEVYRDRWDWGATGGYEGYFQDPGAWAEGGYLDVAVPMTYDPITTDRCSRADWDCLTEDHVATFQTGSGRQVYAGIAAWHGIVEIERAVALGRGYGVAGFALYSYSQIEKQDGLWDALAKGPFSRYAVIPAQPWKPVITPATPTA